MFLSTVTVKIFCGKIFFCVSLDRTESIEKMIKLYWMQNTKLFLMKLKKMMKLSKI